MSAPDVIAEYVAAELSSSLATNLTTLESIYADNIELGTPKFWRAQQDRYPGNLNLVILTESSDPVNNNNLNRFAVRVEIIVAGEQGHATWQQAEVLNKRLWRVVRGVQGTLHCKSLSGNVETALIDEIRHTSSLEGDQWHEQRAEALIDVIISV